MHFLRRQLLPVLLLVTSCADKQAPLPGDDHVLAKVGNTAITQYDLDQSLKRTFGDIAAGIDSTTRRKALESLVLSRAISLARQREISGGQRSAIQRRSEALLEEEMVRDYLDAHTKSRAVSDEQVQKYYDQHPESFGARAVHRYELLASDHAVTGAERDALLGALSNPGTHADWNAWAGELRGRGQAVGYSRGSGNDSILHARLRDLVASLSPGQTSAPTFIDGRLYLIRALDVQQLAPRPLTEVQAEIRSALVPLQIKQAIREVGQQALSATKVEYLP